MFCPVWISADCPAYVAHPYTDQAMPHTIQHPCSIVIGPEGGFIPYEIDLLEKRLPSAALGQPYYSY